MTGIVAGSVYVTLLKVCTNNEEYFEELKDEKSRRMSAAFVALKAEIESLLPLLNEFRNAAPSYDFKNVPANGYRSYIIAADKFSNVCLRISQNVWSNRNSLFFKKAFHIKEIERCIEVYDALNECFHLLQVFRMATRPHKLFLERIDKMDCIEKCINKVKVRAFYGRFIGFQFGHSTQPLMKTIAIITAAFAEYYYNKKNVIQAAAMCRKFSANPEARALCMEQVLSYRRIQVQFCKNLANLLEHDIMKKLKVFLSSAHAVNQIIRIPPESIQYCNGDHIVDIPIPNAYVGSKTLQIRLISSTKREGMGHVKGKRKPPSDWFIFHLHGGGFVALTSESHHIFLKNWSLWTNDTPILSVDYSLAPEAPHPRAIEEILYAYVWALSNKEKLGTTARRIVFAGDSAGANLCLGLLLKCIDLNIRKPDGLFLAYGPTILQFYPCPSRFLGLMDPLLSFGFMMCAIKAYVHVNNGKKDSSSADKNTREKDDASSETDDLIEYTELSGSGSSENTENASSSPQFSNRFQQETISSGITDAPSVNEPSLSFEDECIIKEFASNLEHNASSEVSKNQLQSHTNCIADFAEVASFSQLMNEVQDNIYLSPVTAGASYFKEFPPTSLFTVEMDPCLDDFITLAKELDKVDKHVYLDVLPNLCHGFLNISLNNKEAQDASRLCAQRIKELLEGNLPKA